MSEQDGRPDVLDTPEVEFIFSVTTYKDNNGRVLTERTVVSGTPPDDFARFTVSASIKAATPMGPAEWQFEIPLSDATTPKEAYAALDLEWPRAVKNAEQELNAFVKEQVAAAKSRILVPGGPVPPAQGDGGPLQMPGMRGQS